MVVGRGGNRGFQCYRPDNRTGSDRAGLLYLPTCQKLQIFNRTVTKEHHKMNEKSSSCVVKAAIGTYGYCVRHWIPYRAQRTWCSNGIVKTQLCDCFHTSREGRLHSMCSNTFPNCRGMNAEQDWRNITDAHPGIDPCARILNESRKILNSTKTYFSQQNGQPRRPRNGEARTWWGITYSADVKSVYLEWNGYWSAPVINLT